MSHNRQLHRLIVTSWNNPSFLSVAGELQRVLAETLFNMDEESFIICSQEVSRHIDIRNTVNADAHVQLHLVMQVYWHEGINDEWRAFQGTAQTRLLGAVKQVLPHVEPEVIVRSVIEERPYNDCKNKVDQFKQLPRPMILDMLFETQSKPCKLTVDPYTIVQNRREQVLMPITPDMKVRLYRYLSARCIVTPQLLCHLPDGDQRLKTLLVDEHDELSRFMRTSTSEEHFLPYRGMALWLYTQEETGNSSNMAMHKICNAMQLFAAGEVLNGRSLNLTERTLNMLSKEPIRLTMGVRVSHISTQAEQSIFHTHYQLPATNSSTYLYILWPQTDPVDGHFSISSAYIDLEPYLSTNFTENYLQMCILNDIIKTSIPMNVKNILSTPMRDDLLRDHYKRYFLRTLNQFWAIYRIRDQMLIDPCTRLTEWSHGVLHAVCTEHVSLSRSIEAASPMVLLSPTSYVESVKTHFHRYKSDTNGLVMTPDMLQQTMGSSMDSLLEDKNIYVAYYEVQLVPANVVISANCGALFFDHVVRPLFRSFHSTCHKVDLTTLERCVIEMRTDCRFLDNIYTDPLQLNFVNKNWASAINSLRNIYKTPFREHIPPPLELDLMKQSSQESSRVVDIIRSPLVHTHLQSLLKTVSHLVDCSQPLEVLLQKLISMVERSQTVNEALVESVSSDVLQKAIYKTITEKRPFKRKREHRLTIEQVSKAWNLTGDWDPCWFTIQEMITKFGGSDTADACSTADWRDFLMTKYTTFWIVEVDKFDNLHTFYCQDKVWNCCTEEDLLCAPFRYTDPILHFYRVKTCNNSIDYEDNEVTFIQCLQQNRIETVI